MERIIINCHGVKAADALQKVKLVIEGGRVSNARKIKHYCWATTFNDKTTVEVRQKKTKDSPDSFIVYKN